MMRLLLVLALLGCEKDQPSDEPSAALQEFGRKEAAKAEAKVKVKALEAAQLAAREAEAAAKAAIEGAEKAKQEMLAAKDELAKTSAERVKLADEGRALLATARAQLATMESQLANMAAKRDEAKAALAKMTDEQKRNAAAGIAELEKKYDEAAVQLQRLRATMAELEKSLAQ